MDLPRLGGSLGDAPLQIVVHRALGQACELTEHERPAPENGDISGYEPAVTAGPALDSILLQTDTNELGPLADDALMAPIEPRRDPWQTRGNPDGVLHPPRYHRGDVLDADGQDQVSFLQHRGAVSADVQRVDIRQIEGQALLDHRNPEQLAE